jgi:hypothetical protein
MFGGPRQGGVNLRPMPAHPGHQPLGQSPHVLFTPLGKTFPNKPLQFRLNEGRLPGQRMLSKPLPQEFLQLFLGKPEDGLVAQLLPKKLLSHPGRKSRIQIVLIQHLKGGFSGTAPQDLNG